MEKKMNAEFQNEKESGERAMNENMIPLKIFRAAQEYSRMGLMVIPLVDGEDGLFAEVSRILSRAIPVDSGQLQKWFYDGKYRNIGIVCGLSSNLVVIDFVGEGWNESYEIFSKAFPEIVSTWTIQKDDGTQQLWLRTHGLLQNMTSRFRTFNEAKIILKAHGQYVVAPPSKSRFGNFSLNNPKAKLLEITKQQLIDITSWLSDEYNQTPKWSLPGENVSISTKINREKSKIVLPENATKGFIQLSRSCLDLWWDLSDGERVLLMTYLMLAKWYKTEIGKCPYSDREIAGKLKWSRSTVLKHKKSLAKRELVKSEKGIKGVLLLNYKRLVVCGRKQDDPGQ
jgi:hypothetical protein